MSNETTIEVPCDWTPRPYQLPFFKAFDGGKKRAVLVEHRRAGKDIILIRYTSKAMFERVGNYWHLFPKQTQAKKAMWRGINPHTGKKILSEVFPEQIRRKTNQQELSIETINGALYQLAGSDNYDSLVGSPPIGVIFSEWPLCNPAAWDYIRPILRENGGWAAFAYTPRGRNHGWTLYKMAKDNPNWHTELLTIDDTQKHDGSRIITPEMIAEERAEGMGEDKIQQEYYCSFDAPIPGAVYGAEMTRAREDKRIGHIPIEQIVDVDTYWDLGRSGRSGNMAIWFVQHVNREIRCISYYQNHGVGMSHYVQQLMEFKAKHGIRYGKHYAPHDIGVTELMTNKTRLQTAREMGITFILVPRIDKLQNGIEATRRIFPRLFFDEVRCEFGINAISSYHNEFNEKTQTYLDEPVHDWSSDAADALRQIGQTSRGDGVHNANQFQPVKIQTNIDPFNTNQFQPVQVKTNIPI